MKLKIRTKVLLGILFLFAEFLFIGILSMSYFSALDTSTKLMIEDNYKSVQYSENMLQAIDEIHEVESSLFINKLYNSDKNLLNVAFAKFEENLKLEENNITEVGEKELAQSINQKYFKYKSIIFNQKIDSVTDKSNYYFVNFLPLATEIKAKVFSVSNLNMQAIIQKNEGRKEMLKTIYKNFAIAVAVCFILAFYFLFNFPNYIVQPIKDEIDEMQKIAINKFKTKIDFSSNDEFVQLSETFNFVIEKLDEKPKPIIIEKEVIKNMSAEEKNIIREIHTLVTSLNSLMISLEKIENKKN